MQYMEKALAELDEQIATLQQTRTHMAAALGRPATSYAAHTGRVVNPGGRGGTRRPMSEEAKQKIRDAQARRWASKNNPPAPVPPVVAASAPVEEPPKVAQVVAPPTEAKRPPADDKKKEEPNKSVAKK